MKRRMAILVVAVILVTLAILAAVTHFVSQTQVRNALAAEMQQDAWCTLSVLSEARRGRTNAVFEWLELEIDKTTRSASQQLQREDESARESAIDFLKEVKRYRSEHPRKIEAEIYEWGMRDGVTQGIEAVKRILSQIE